jgi:hypothetical protein
MMVGNRAALAWLAATALLMATPALGQVLAPPEAPLPPSTGPQPRLPPCPDRRLLQEQWGGSDGMSEQFAPRLDAGPEAECNACGPRWKRISGWCGPAVEESWLCRPCSLGWLVGIVQGGPILHDWVGLDQGLQAGIRLGWDFRDTWGLEARFAYASVGVNDSARAAQALWDLDTLAGYPANSPYRHRFDSRNADLFQCDLDVICYPWGDTWLRPYLIAGVGATDVHLTDRIGTLYHRFAFSMPLGVGLKYRCSESVAVRLDLIDDIAFLGSGMETQNNLSLTLGMEARFGGPRKTYWPWNPDRHFWHAW